MGFPQDFHLSHPLAGTTALYLLRSNYAVLNTEKHARRLFFKNLSKVLKTINGTKLAKGEVKVNCSTDTSTQTPEEQGFRKAPNENSSAQR